MPAKKTTNPEASYAAREKLLLSKIERARLAIAEHEGELANFLTQRRELDAQVQQAGSTTQRAQLVFARGQVADEVQGCQLLLADSRTELEQAQVALDALQQERQVLPAIAARVAAFGRAQTALLACTDELLASLQEAQQGGVRLPVAGLLPGGGASLLTGRLDLLPRSMPALLMDQSGSISCRHVAVADAKQTDLLAEVA
jgi:hypothetical protein